MKNQLDLFASVISVYRDHAGEAISNNTLYQKLHRKLNLGNSLDEKHPVGKDGVSHNLLKRKLRWFQQTLKQAGVINKVEGERGVWRLTKVAEGGLNEVLPQYSVLGFSTNLGVAILGSCKDVFKNINEPIDLILTSPPYPLSKARNYGNVTEKEFVDWICDTLTPVIKNMSDGASIALNLGNDIFIPGSPARSMYKERLILALNDRFDLSLMDNLIWHNPSKPPGPIAWASKQRFQLNAGYENIIWMCNNPAKCFSDNTRVLQPHTEKHLKFMRDGGERVLRVNSDGAHRKIKGAYSKETSGKIPRNIITMGHACAEQREYKSFCRENEITAHGATMPLKLAKFLANFLARAGQLVVDPFAGSFTVPKAAELLGMRWMATDIMLEYVMGGASRFRSANGYQFHF